MWQPLSSLPFPLTGGPQPAPATSVLPLGMGVTQNGSFHPNPQPNQPPIIQTQPYHPPYGGSQVAQMFNDVQGALKTAPLGLQLKPQTPAQPWSPPQQLPSSAPATCTTFQSNQNSPWSSAPTAMSSPGSQSNQSWTSRIPPNMWSTSNSLSNWASSASIGHSGQAQRGNGNGSWGSVPNAMGPVGASLLQQQPQNLNGSGSQFPAQDPFVVRPMNQYSSPAAVTFPPSNNQNIGRTGGRFHPYQSRGVQQTNNTDYFGVPPTNTQPTYAPTMATFQPQLQLGQENSTTTPFRATPPAPPRASMSPSSRSPGSDVPRGWSGVPSPPSVSPPSNNYSPSMAHTGGGGPGPIRRQQKFSSSTSSLGSSIWSVASPDQHTFTGDFYTQLDGGRLPLPSGQGWPTFQQPASSVSPPSDTSFNPPTRQMQASTTSSFHQPGRNQRSQARKILQGADAISTSS